MPKIALIHALAHSMRPIQDALARSFPQAQAMSVLDDSLSADLARRPSGLDASFFKRFHQLTDYVLEQGCEGILFTCSAFGPCIEDVARKHPGTPVLKPNEAMINDAVRLADEAGASIGLIATFAPTLETMPAEFPGTHLPRVMLAQGALQALDQGDGTTHDALAVEAALRLKHEGCQVICLAQFSLARAAAAVREATGLPVLTTPDSAVAELQRRLKLD